jgi:hypothetical protein
MYEGGWGESQVANKYNWCCVFSSTSNIMNETDPILNWRVEFWRAALTVVT